VDFQSIINFIRFLYPDKEFISLHEPIFTGNERKYVMDCLDTTFVSSVGKYVDHFEERVCNYTGTGDAIATVNGTAALHMALMLAGVSRNDLVITQPLTFIATCNAISYCGAEPVFIDIDRVTLGLSVDALNAWLEANVEIVEKDGLDSGFTYQQKAQLTQLPKLAQSEFICLHKDTKRRISACIPMHTFGHPCEIDKIVEICKKYHIPVVEDAAESIGSLYKNKHTGTFGLMGILSFNGNKTITTGGGGMILTDDEYIARLAKHLTTQAKIQHPWKFEHDQIGYNYRLPNINAALGCAQLEKIEEFVKFKRDIADKYRQYFSEMGIRFVTEPQFARSNYWLNAILFDSEVERDEFLKLSNDNGVMSRPGWTLMHKLPMFNNAYNSDLSIAESVESRLVNLPSGVVL